MAQESFDYMIGVVVDCINSSEIKSLSASACKKNGSSSTVVRRAGSSEAATKRDTQLSDYQTWVEKG